MPCPHGRAFTCPDLSHSRITIAESMDDHSCASRIPVPIYWHLIFSGIYRHSLSCLLWFWYLETHAYHVTPCFVRVRAYAQVCVASGLSLRKQLIKLIGLTNHDASNCSSARLSLLSITFGLVQRRQGLPYAKGDLIFCSFVHPWPCLQTVRQPYRIYFHRLETKPAGDRILWYPGKRR